MTLDNAKDESAQTHVGDDAASEHAPIIGPTSGLVFLEEPIAAEVVLQDMTGNQLHRMENLDIHVFSL